MILSRAMRFVQDAYHLQEAAFLDITSSQEIKEHLL